MKKIAVVGAQGTGKSLLCERLYEKCGETGRSVVYVPEVVRKCPLPIHSEQTIASTMWIVMRQIQEEIEAEHLKPEIVICDRSVYDPMVYLLYANQNEVNQDLCDFLNAYAKSYNKLILVRPSKAEIVEDEFRATNKEYQYAINNIFTSWIIGRCQIVESDEIFGPYVDRLCKNIIEDD